jgi:hypothetical protein
MMTLAAGTIDCGTTGANGLDAGSLANSTWYHVYAIGKPDGMTAFLASTSVSAPTMPTGYTFKRRIGSVKTDGSAHILAFVQDSDKFEWASPVADISATNPGTSAVDRTVTVPTGVNVLAELQIVMNSSGASFSYVLVTDKSTTDTAPSSTLTDCSPGGGTPASVKYVRTNTSAQVRSRNSFSDASTGLTINTLGWIDRRGKES